MPKFIKKQIEIEAEQWTGDNIEDISIFLKEAVDWHYRNGKKAIPIQTLDGTMYAETGDWIIKESFPTKDRTYYPCKPDIFEQTYEPAE